MPSLVNPRSPCPPPRLPAPIDTAARSVPSQRGLRLNHLDHIEQPRPKPNHANYEGAATTVQSNLRRQMPQCEIQLMPKKHYLDFRSDAQLDPVGNSHSNGIKECEHRVASRDDSAQQREPGLDGIFGKDSHDGSARHSCRILIYANLIACYRRIINEATSRSWSKSVEYKI